jgi:hypothetical protein
LPKATFAFVYNNDIAEIKRNPKKINIQTLTMKIAAIQKQLAKYKISLKTLSLNDM